MRRFESIVGKKLATSIFPFSYNGSKVILTWGCLNSGLFGKGSVLYKLIWQNAFVAARVIMFLGTTKLYKLTCSTPTVSLTCLSLFKVVLVPLATTIVKFLTLPSVSVVKPSIDQSSTWTNFLWLITNRYPNIWCLWLL